MCTLVLGKGNFPSPLVAVQPLDAASFNSLTEGVAFEKEQQQHVYSQPRGLCSQDFQIKTDDAACFQDSQTVGVYDAKKSSWLAQQDSQLDAVVEPFRTGLSTPRRLVVHRIKGSSRFSVGDASLGALWDSCVGEQSCRSENTSQGAERQANSFKRLIDSLDH